MRPKHPASVAIDSATYLLMISSPDNYMRLQGTAMCHMEYSTTASGENCVTFTVV